jgi:hypothetical protein
LQHRDSPKIRWQSLDWRVIEENRQDFAGGLRPSLFNNPQLTQGVRTFAQGILTYEKYEQIASFDRVPYSVVECDPGEQIDSIKKHTGSGVSQA